MCLVFISKSYEFLDFGPNDSGHLVTVEIDDWVLNLDTGASSRGIFEF